MPHKFILKTQSGNFYEILDESNAFGSDHWVSIIGGRRKALLCFGDLRKAESIMTQVNGRSPIEYLRVLEGQIGSALKTKNCLGKRLVFVEESQFKVAIQWLEQLQAANRANDRNRLSQLWSVLSKSVHSSTPVVEIFENF
jgi:hypothetical protein